MGFLRTDYSEVNAGFKPLPIGEYECIISEAKVTQSSTNKDMVKLTLTVRDDVEQEGQKRKFFDNLVVQENMNWKFQQVLKAAQIPEGTDLDSPADFASAVQYKCVTIKNKHRVYEGETQDVINYYTESKYGAGEGSAPSGDDPFQSNGQIDISDDDLPF